MSAIDGIEGTGYTYTGGKLVLGNHRAVAPDEPGIGVEFAWEAFEPYRMRA